MDSRIKKYTKKDGTTAYMFKLYLGIDPQTGKQKYTTRRGISSIRNAEKELKKVEYQTSQGLLTNVTDKSNITFEEVYEEWYLGYINTVRESTYSRTRGMFDNHILPALGKYKIKMITTAQCQKALNEWYDQTEVNYKKWFNYVKAIFSYADRQEYISKNPIKKIVMPKKHDYKKKSQNFWDKQQLKTFFSHIDSQNELEKYTLFRLLAFTGIRRGECLALTWNDLDLDSNTLDINKTLTQGLKGKQIVQATKTKKGTRRISLDSVTVSYLKKWRLEQRTQLLMLGFNSNNKDQLIFATSKNTHKSLNTPSKWSKPIIEKSKLPPITIHGFRHSHASALFSAGATIKEVQERLGHEDAQTTLNIYTHTTEKQDKEAVNKLVNFLNF